MKFNSLLSFLPYSIIHWPWVPKTMNKARVQVA